MTVVLEGLSFSYGRRVALDNVSAVCADSIVAILGPNGAGKSTLLRILASQSRPESGTFSVNDLDTATPRAKLAYRRKLGWMPQSLGMFGGYTCQELLRYVAWMREVPAAQVELAVADALELVNLTSQRAQKIKTLSGGMRQRVGLAQSVVNRPTTLILDEPTVGLDPRERSDFRQYLRRLSGSTQILLSTHLVDDVAALASEVLVLADGRVKFTGSIYDFAGTGESRTVTAGEVEAAYLKIMPSVEEA